MLAAAQDLGRLQLAKCRVSTVHQFLVRPYQTETDTHMIKNNNFSLTSGNLPLHLPIPYLYQTDIITDIQLKNPPPQTFKEWCLQQVDSV